MNDADGADEESARAEAHRWIVRMHGPDAADSAEAFRAWLDQDERHQPIYEQLQAHWDRGKFLTHTGTGRARNLGSVAIWYKRPGTRYAVAAMLAVFILAAGLTLPRMLRRADTSVTTAFATRTGEVRTIALADGSHVTLDGETRLQVSMTDVAREVRLIDGSARFDVRPDAARSFAVLTLRGSVTTDDGLFDVTRTLDLVRVTSFRGTLRFKSEPPTPGLGSPAALAIAPGQRLSLSGGRRPEVTSAAPAATQDWTHGMLAFDRERLADAVAEMNRHNARKIVLADPSLGELEITGAFHADDASGFARTVATLLGLERCERSDGAIELSRAKKKVG